MRRRARANCSGAAQGLHRHDHRPGFIGQQIELRVKRYGNSAREFKRIARNPFKRTRR